MEEERAASLEAINGGFDLFPPPDLSEENEEDYLLYTRGLFRHPGDVLPMPAREDTDEHGVEVSWSNAPGKTDFSDMRGNIFVDGSCVAHKIPELSRAGWGVE